MRNIIKLGTEVLDADCVSSAWLSEAGPYEGKMHYYVKYVLSGETHSVFWKDDKPGAEACLATLTNAMKGERQVLKEITTDAKAFIQEHRNIIYWLALAFLADHFFFNGTFRARLNAMVEKMIGKVEKQLEAQK